MPDFGIYAGDTSKTIYVRLRDSTTGLAKTGLLFNSAGASASYTLPLAASATITLATQTVTGAWSSGGFVEVNNTTAKGLYRLDLPDAAIASGDFTVISIEFDGIIEESIEIPLHTRDVNVTQWLGTAVATPTVNGVPEVDITHVGGATTNVAALATNVDAIKTKTDFLPSATAGAAGGVFIAGTNAATTITTALTTTFTGNLTGSVGSLTGHTNQTGDTYALANGATGFNAIDTVVDAIKVVTDALPDGGALTTLQADTDDIQTRLPAALTKGTADSGTTTTCVDAARTEADTDYWKGSFIRFTSGTIADQTRLITGFTPGTDTITFSPATTQAVGTNTYEILPAGAAELLAATQTSIDNIETDTNSLNDTKIPNTLNTTASGNIGIDWANVENPATAVDLAATDIQLCDTVTTLTGHTAQTGDTYALANGATGFTAIDTVVDAIKVKTDFLPSATAGAAGGVFISGTNSSLTITGSTTLSDGLIVNRSSSNTSAIVAAGNGTGHGISTTGGATGHGLNAAGGATSGHGINSVATLLGKGIVATGVGSGQAGIEASGGATASHGILATGNTTGAGIRAAGGTSGSGIGAVGGGTGSGIYAQSGTSNNANGIYAESLAGGTQGYGIRGVGSLAGSGMRLDGGATGHGLEANGGTNGDGIVATLGGTGVDIRGDITGDLSGSVGSVTAIATNAITADALATDAVDEIRDGLLPTQNATFNNIMFLFVAASDHVTPVTAASGTGVTRSIDGAAFGAGTGTLAEVGNGMYQYDASAADMNGGVITFRFTATGGTPGAPDDAFVTIVTGGGV